MTNVLNAVKNGFSNVKSHITELASQAFTWGKDLVMGIVNGIKSCIGAVGDAVKGVADKIKSFLHFQFRTKVLLRNTNLGCQTS